MTTRFAHWAAASFLCMSVAVPIHSARGDVTAERFIKSGGIRGIGASESTVVEKLSGLKKHEKSSVKMTGSVGGFLSRIAGDMGSDVITVIPRDVVWTLDHKKKTYIESRITLPKGKEEPSGRAEETKAEETKQETSKVRVIRNEISVKETGEKKTVNGFDCSRYVITWLIETENIDTGERAKTTMTNDLWNTPETKETRALQKEELEFAVAYMKKMGLDISAEDAGKFGMAAVAGMFGEDDRAVQEKLKELQEKMAKVKGYPIVTALKWVTETSGPPRQAPKEQAETESEDADLSGGIGGLLGGLARKTVKQKASESVKDGRKEENVLFDVYSEIKRIDVSSIPASDFEVPAGYKMLK